MSWKGNYEDAEAYAEIFREQILTEEIICKILGIKYPILMGGMMLVSESGLVSAVSNAGGLGIFATGDKAQKGGIERIRDEIKRIKTLTDQPFGVYVAMTSPIVLFL